MKRAAALVLLLASCAHRPAAVTSADAPENRVWPAPPAHPLVRFLGSFPRADRAPPGISFWQRVLGLIVGTEPSKRHPGTLLERPFGIAAARSGFVVADPDGRKVFRVDARHDEATALECLQHPWKMPLGVAVGPENTVYVADGGAALVLRISADGTCRAIGAGALERPSGVALLAGRIYVADPPRHQIVAFTPDGRERLRFGARGESSGEFNFPSALSASADGTLLVVDALNFRIVRCSAEGEVLNSFGEPGDGNGAFGRPKGVVTDPAGRIFVSDAQNDVVIVFSPEGAFETAVGGSGNEAGSLTLPAGVAVGDGMLYVADSYNHRVQIFQLLAGEPP